MKKVLCVVLVLLLMAGSFLLGRATAPAAASKTFYAEILENREGLLLVRGLEVNDINHRWEFYLTAEEDTEILWRGMALTAADLQAGQNVAVTYTGAVQETAPARIQTVLKIELLEDER